MALFCLYNTKFFFFNFLKAIRANALLSAIELLQNATAKKKFTSRRILFISNFDGYICSDKIDDICADMKQHGIDLNVM